MWQLFLKKITYFIKYDKIIPHLVKAIQELNSNIKKIEEKILEIELNNV